MRAYVRVCVSVCVYVCVYVRECVRMCERSCVSASVCECVHVYAISNVYHRKIAPYMSDPKLSNIIR